MRTWAAARAGARLRPPTRQRHARLRGRARWSPSRHPRHHRRAAASPAPSAPAVWHVSDGSDVRRTWAQPPDPVTAALGVLGHVGLTAMVGLTLIAPPQGGRDRAGVVRRRRRRRLAGQIARLMGARVVGIAGGPEKTALCRDEYGFDAALDHRACDDLTGAIALAGARGRRRVLRQRRGSHVLDAALPCMNEPRTHRRLRDHRDRQCRPRPRPAPRARHPGPRAVRCAASSSLATRATPPCSCRRSSRGSRQATFVSSRTSPRALATCRPHWKDCWQARISARFSSTSPRRIHVT